MKYFFDIGANAGEAFDWHLAKTNAHDGWEVFLFEPSPRSFAALLAKAKQMSTRYKVTVLPFAVGGETGTANFYESVDSECDTLQPNSVNNDLWNRHNTAAGYKVIAAVVRLSDFILRHTKPEDAIVIKLDAEGAEYGIIDDLLANRGILPRIKQMLIEWHWVAKDQPAERRLEARLMAQLRDAGVDAQIWGH